jgi:hypothetical protein
MENDMTESNIDLDFAKSCTSTIFNKSTLVIANSILETLYELYEYKPFTIRQVYYQQVAKGIIPNKLNKYRAVSRLLVKLRENDIVPWKLIVDNTRRTTKKRGHSNVQAWLREKLNYLDPKYYGRCYVQKQDVYVEVSTEKDALASIIDDEIYGYCTRLNVVRGQVSATFIEQMAQRFDAAVMRGQTPVLLHCGDLDPSGISIPKAIKRNLLERHSVDVDVRHVALTPEQVKHFELLTSLDAVKEKDPNYQQWIKAFGPEQASVELDALHPKQLRQLLREALHNTYNIDSFDPEIQKEKEERIIVNEVKQDILALLFDKYDMDFYMD